jgi:hypothetical protein
MSTVLAYLGLLVVGLRWSTLPQDIEFVQELFNLGGKFGLSLFKSLCKKKMSEYTSLSETYPRPPRTFDYVSECNVHESTDLKQEDESDESIHESDADQHKDEASQDAREDQEE